MKCVGISTTLFHSGFHYTSVVVRCTNCEVSGDFFFFFCRIHLSVKLGGRSDSTIQGSEEGRIAEVTGSSAPDERETV